ncbi:hypothetical protein [Actinorugispora endophytica]|uniref:hypothetical protein n=1 Tax=Actinorugispora endophytica TaxID=1605990 RepID=UPI001061C50B|nr:hypothetical protein [Actinorugispora endophytica]
MPPAPRQGTPRRDTVTAPATQRALRAASASAARPGDGPDVAAVMRGQLRSGLRAALGGAGVLIVLPALFTLVGQLNAAHFSGMRPGWLVVGALLPPLLVLVMTVHIRFLERLDAEAERKGPTRR